MPNYGVAFQTCNYFVLNSNKDMWYEFTFRDAFECLLNMGSNAVIVWFCEQRKQWVETKIIDMAV